MKYHLIVAGAILTVLFIPYCLANPVVSPFEEEEEVPEIEGWGLLIIALSPPLEAVIALFLLWRGDRNMTKLFWIVTGTNIVTVLATTAMFLLLQDPIGVLLSYITAEIVPVSIEISFLFFMIPRTRSFKGVYPLQSLIRTFIFANVVTCVIGVLYIACLYRYL
jgi:hypothetical protein